MELNRISLPPLSVPGEVMTFYAGAGEAVTSAALSNIALLLASRRRATTPVLMVDWDVATPGLCAHSGTDPSLAGLHDLFAECATVLAELGNPRGAPHDTALATRVLEAVGWQDYLVRADDARQLYLIGPGDPSRRVDWAGLHAACPALYRVFASQLCCSFEHVLVNARGGSSPETRICTTLLPGKLVGLFTPSPGSLDALAGTLLEAAAYRRSHEEAQGVWQVYPLPCEADASDSARREAWRRGEPRRGQPGYQAELEKLLRGCYGMRDISLDSYFDEVMLQHDDAGRIPPAHRGDRLSLQRSCEALLHWAEEGAPAWRSRQEVSLLREIAQARPLARGDADSTAPLAASLYGLGEHYVEAGRDAQAIECVQESAGLQALLYGDQHAATLASRALLARLLREAGDEEALDLSARVFEDCSALFGALDARTLAARTGLAEALSLRGEYELALRHHEQAKADCERVLGRHHPLTLDSAASEARSLARKGDFERARMVYEHVLDARQRLSGSAHPDTLDCMHELAMVLIRLGDAAQARALQEGVLAARERERGAQDPQAQRERIALYEIMSGQGDAGPASRREDGCLPVPEAAWQPARHERLSGRFPPGALVHDEEAPRSSPMEGARRPASGIATLPDDMDRLRQLLKRDELAVARELADHIRGCLRRVRVPDELRARASTLVRQVYHLQGDRLALDAFQKEDLAAYDERDGGRGEMVRE